MSSTALCSVITIIITWTSIFLRRNWSAYLVSNGWFNILCVLLFIYTWVLDFSACYRFKKQPWSLSYLLFLSSGELESVCIFILCCPHLHCPIKAKSESSATLVTTLGKDQISSLVKEIQVFSFSPSPWKSWGLERQRTFENIKLSAKKFFWRALAVLTTPRGGWL